MTFNSNILRRSLHMLGLILAAEAVFALPFHVARFFRPTVLEVFQLSATELGAAQGMYGIFAMLAYFPGGVIADRFAARKLLAVSLWLTALGGFYLASFPNYKGALLVWGFFGLSTILFFWAAMIRACREWGKHNSQGLAFGLLESGRGLLAAGLASIGVLLFSMAFPEGYASANFAEKEAVLRQIIYGYTFVTAATGFLVWWIIPDTFNIPHNISHQAPPLAATNNKNLNTLASHLRPSLSTNTIALLKIPALWLNALIVVCAYVGFKGFDNYTLFAVQGYGIDEVEAARIVAIGSWTRPIIALAAGLLGDRLGSAKTLLFLFAVLLFSDLFFALTTPVPNAGWVMLGNTIITCIAIFGFRGLYFALLEEANIPHAMTGSAVGFVSVLGFTPDIFVSYVGGVLIDASPGLAGHQHFFLFLAAFAALGMIASWVLMRLLHSKQSQ